MSIQQQLLNPLFGASLKANILGYFGSDLLLYYPMSEAAGTTADNAEGTAARDGTYSGAALADATFLNGNPVPRFDGTTDVLNAYSANLAAAIDMKEVGVLFFWKPFNAGVWTDGTARYNVVFQVDSNNYIRMQRKSVDGQYTYTYKAGGTTKSRTEASLSYTGWNLIALSVSKSADQMIPYRNDAAVGAALTGLGTFSGALDSDRTVFGAFNNTTKANSINGWQGHSMVIDRPITLADVQFVYNSRYS